MDAAEPVREPAILAFRGRSGLLFANPAARALLGPFALETEDLQALCIRLFPGATGHDRVASILHRALSGRGLPGGESFRAVFRTREGGQREGLFHVDSWREMDGEYWAMLSCPPAGYRDFRAPGTLSSMGSLSDLMERIQELLDVAVTVGRVSRDGGFGAEDPGLVQRLEEARGLLAGLERGA